LRLYKPSPPAQTNKKSGGQLILAEIFKGFDALEVPKWAGTWVSSKGQSSDVVDNPFLDRAIPVLETDILALQDKRIQS
jgi:hypothetical protein